MKFTFKTVIPVLAVAVLITSCGGGNKPASVLVPENAGVVLHISGASLNAKLSWEDVKNTDWYKLMMKDEGEDMTPVRKAILENPENSGIDIKSDFYVFYEIRGTHGYTVVQGGLADAKKFETLITSGKEKPQVKKEGNISIAAKGDEMDGCLTWTNDHFIFVSAEEAPFADTYSRYMDKDNDKKEAPFTTDSLVKYAKDLYNLKQGKSMGSNDHFTSTMKEAGDMHFFFNSNMLPKTDLGPMALVDIYKFTKGNESGTAINFDNGKITANSRSWYNKDINEMMDKYKPGKINEDMLKRIPSQNLAAVIAINYPPEAFKDFFKLIGADGLLNAGLAQVGFSIDDFVKANKGDVLIAVSDFAVKEKTIKVDMGDAEPYSYTKTQPDANILFATSVNDKAAFSKLMDAAKSQAGQTEGAANELEAVKYAMNDNWFIIGNNQQTIDDFAAGKGAAPSPLISQISSHQTGGFIDLQKILPFVLAEKEKTEKDQLAVNEAIQTWDNIVFWGGERDGSARLGHLEINMKDKNTNSLKQLFTFINKMAAFEMNDSVRDTGIAVPDSSVTRPGIIMEEPQVKTKPGK